MRCSVAWIISSLARRAFEKANEERTVALVAQFRREFNRRGEEVSQRVQAIAASEASTRMALALSRGVPDYGTYLNEAGNIATNQQLDFLEFLTMMAPLFRRRNGRRNLATKKILLPRARFLKLSFLKQEELPEGEALGLCAIREIKVSDKPPLVLGCRRIDKDFLASLELPSGMRAMLYESPFHQDGDAGFSPQLLIDAAGPVQRTDPIAPLIQQIQQQQQRSICNWFIGHQIPPTMRR